MSEEFQTQEITLADALQMQIYTTQALMDLLVDKGIITYQEILARVEVIKEDYGLSLPGSKEQ